MTRWFWSPKGNVPRLHEGVHAAVQRPLAGRWFGYGRFSPSLPSGLGGLAPCPTITCCSMRAGRQRCRTTGAQCRGFRVPCFLATNQSTVVVTVQNHPGIYKCTSCSNAAEPRHNLSARRRRACWLRAKTAKNNENAAARKWLKRPKIIKMQPPQIGQNGQK